MADTKKYVSKINGYHVKDVEARQLASDAYGLAEQAKLIAEGGDLAIVYDTFDDMIEALYNTDTEGYATTFKVGTHLLIRDKNVPDYWVSEYKGKDPGSLTPEESETLGGSGMSEESITVNGSITSVVVSGTADAEGKYPQYWVGFAVIDILETSKVDLAGYMTSATANATYAKQTGTYSGMTVGTATKATQDGNGNNIASTYATKAELSVHNITFAVANEELTILKNGSKPFNA